MRNCMITLVAVLVTTTCVMAQSGPKDIIPAPFHYEVTKGTTSLPEAADMDIRIGSKKFLSRIKGYGLEDWQV